jgi:hypothetical protein
MNAERPIRVLGNAVRPIVLAVACVGVGVCWGCVGGGSANTTATEEFAEARARLAAALDGWKKGRAAGPNLDDQDARSGLKLASYEIRDPPAGWNAEVGLGAVLSLKDRKGRKIVRHAVYRVSKTPELIVTREE